MRRQLVYRKLPYQKDFHLGRKFYDALFAGFGAGKTYSLCMKMLQLAEANRGLPGGLLAPNLKMFKRDVLPTLVEICNNFGINYKYHRQDSIFELRDTGNIIYIFHAEDDGFSIKGPNLAFGLINEVTLCSKGAFEAFISRIRLKRAQLRQVAMSGTPEGFNWTYDFFVANPREDADVFYGDMRLNTHVAAEYAKMLSDSYDAELVQQYVEGKFVNINSLAAFHKFSRARHANNKIERIKGRPIWVSLDFNVAPMTACLFNRMPDKEDVWLRGFDEIVIKGSDTYQLSRVLKEKTVGDDPIVIFPDPAGGHRDTRNNVSDLDILREEGFKELRHRSKIMSVRDCLNASNSFIGKGRLQLDKDKCRETIIDFEQTVLKAGTNELDKSNPDRTHLVDGFKNMIDYEFPIKVKAGGWKTVAIR